MTTPYAPARYVAAPSPVAPRFGLFSVSTILEPGSESGAEGHWPLGIEWEPIPCAPASIIGVGCDPATSGNDDRFGYPKTGADSSNLVVGSPFGVYGSFSCSPIGHWSDAEDRALAHLYAGEERAVERAIYRGEAGNDRSLVDPATVDVTPTPGTAVDIIDGFALLESYLGLNHSGIGVIHGNPREITWAASQYLLADHNASATQLTTQLGTLVASEGGMSATIAPNGATTPGNDYWLYATGRPIIRRTAPILTSERGASLNTSNNDLEVIAERIYVVAWDCATAAVLVSRS